MTHSQTSRSRVLRRAGVALVAALAVSTVASSATQAASKPSAGKYGGTANVAIGDTLPGFCFANNPGNTALMAHRTIYETIFEKTIGGDFVGLLAKSAAPVEGTNLKEWNLTLREGIKFHDGTPMNAAAVALNLQYATGAAAITAIGTALATPGNKHAVLATTVYTALASPASTTNPLGGPTGAAILKAFGVTGTSATTAVPQLGTQMIAGGWDNGGAVDKGLQALGAPSLKTLGWNIGIDLGFANASIGIGTSAAFLANIVSTTAPSEYVVKMKLNRAQNDVPGMLFASGRFIVRAPSQFQKAFPGATNICSLTPIGTGPFKVAAGYTMSDTSSLTVEKNSSYWRKDAKTGQQLPYLDKIVFTRVLEPLQRALAVRKGTVDIAMFSANGEGTFIKDLRQRKSLVKEYKTAEEFYPTFFMNLARKNAFQSKNARLAVLHCLDRVGYVKIRTGGTTSVATSLVGKKSIMYSTRGFHKFSIALSKKYVAAWKAEDPANNKEISFSFPQGESSAAAADAKFFRDTWAKCGLKGSSTPENGAVLIAKIFNSGATSPADQNAFDVTPAQLFEGVDVSFNLPFAISNAYASYTAGGVANTSANAAGGLLIDSVGSVLNLGKHKDIDIDKLFFAGQAGSLKTAGSAYQSATARLQTEGYMGAVNNFSYSMFVSTKGKIKNIGVVQIEKGKTQRVVTNYGLDFSGIQKG